MAVQHQITQEIKEEFLDIEDDVSDKLQVKNEPDPEILLFDLPTIFTPGIKRESVGVKQNGSLRDIKIVLPRSHSAPGTTYFVCSHCWQYHHTKAELLLHMNIHPETRDSFDSVKTSARTSSLRNNAAGAKPLVRNRSDKRFVQYSDVYSHVNRPTVENSFVCNSRQNSFRISSAKGSGDISLRETKILLRRSHIVPDTTHFVCSHCWKYYQTKAELLLHMNIHSKIQDSSCESSDRKSSLRNEETGVEPFVRNCSDKPLSSLKGDIRIPSGEPPFICRYCKTCFNLESALKVHIKSHTGTIKFVCNFCQMKFSRNAQLEDHLRIHSGEEPLVCWYCKSSFNFKSDLIVHIRRHVRKNPFVCKYCQKKFSQNDHLEDHIRMHSGNKPFVCRYCKKCFHGESALKVHIRRHTGKKKFVCSYCRKNFFSRGPLEDHLTMHTEEKLYLCNYCNKKFTSKYTLVCHKRIHSTEKLFVCGHCQKSFSVFSYLKDQMRLHTGEKRFVCNHCSKSFNRKDYLAKHILIHTGEIPYIHTYIHTFTAYPLRGRQE